MKPSELIRATIELVEREDGFFDSVVDYYSMEVIWDMPNRGKRLGMCHAVDRAAGMLGYVAYPVLNRVHRYIERFNVPWVGSYYWPRERQNDDIRLVALELCYLMAKDDER